MLPIFLEFVYAARTFKLTQILMKVNVNQGQTVCEPGLNFRQIKSI